MSILDLDNDNELDLRGLRVATNAELSQKTGALWGYLDNPETTDAIITDEGDLKFSGSCEIRAENPIMQTLQDEGVIQSLSCTRANFAEMKYVTPTEVTSKVTCGDMFITKTYGIKDINILIDGSINCSSRYNRTGNSHGIKFQYCFNGLKFDNVNIEFTRTQENLIYANIDDFVDLKGLSSNVEIYKQYTLRDFPEEFMKLFVTGPCKIHDIKKGADVDMPVKNLKKAVAIANNSKRYRLQDHILQVKQGAKFSDLIPTGILKDLQCYQIKNNNVTLMFAKEGSQWAKPWSFSRYPQQSKFRDIDEMYPKTADGWYVIWMETK